MTLCEAISTGLPYRRQTFYRQVVPHDPNPYTNQYLTIDGRHIVQREIAGKVVLRTRRVLLPQDQVATDWEVEP